MCQLVYFNAGSEEKKSAKLRSGHLESVNENVLSVNQKSTNVIEEVKASPKRNSDPHQKQKFFDELVQREGSVEKIFQIKTAAKTVYDVDRMSSIEIRESLARVNAKTTEPFSFLAKIIDDPEENRSELTQNDQSQELNPTDIDVSNDWDNSKAFEKKKCVLWSKQLLEHRLSQKKKIDNFSFLLFVSEWLMIIGRNLWNVSVTISVIT